VGPLIANWHYIWHHKNEIAQMTGPCWPSRFITKPPLCQLS